ARLCDHARLAHPLCEQRLADRVVDLVRAGVVEVLALQPHIAANALGDPLREVERARTADVVAQQAVERLLERGVVARREPGRLELVERGHQRLGDVPAAIRPEPPLDRRLAHAAARSSACATAWKKASTFAGSLRPGSASVPLAV